MKKQYKGNKSPRLVDPMVSYYRTVQTNVQLPIKKRNNIADAPPPPKRTPISVKVDHTGGVPATSVPAAAFIEAPQMPQFIGTTIITDKNEPLITQNIKISSPRASVAKKILKRPSLTDQLASIAAKAGDLTKEMQLRHNLPTSDSTGSTILCSIPVQCFSVGSLTCRYPSPVHFYSDRCEFPFHHPYENTVIHMIMYYKDMSSKTLNSRRMSFNIPHELMHFKLDYQPVIHTIVIEFATKSAVEQIRQKVSALRGR